MVWPWFGFSLFAWVHGNQCKRPWFDPWFGLGLARLFLHVFTEINAKGLGWTLGLALVWGDAESLDATTVAPVWGRREHDRKLA